MCCTLCVSATLAGSLAVSGWAVYVWAVCLQRSSPGVQPCSQPRICIRKVRANVRIHTHPISRSCMSCKPEMCQSPISCVQVYYLPTISCRDTISRGLRFAPPASLVVALDVGLGPSCLPYILSKPEMLWVRYIIPYILSLLRLYVCLHKTHVSPLARHRPGYCYNPRIAHEKPASHAFTTQT